MADDLHEGSSFQHEISVNELADLEDFFHYSQKFIHYEERQLASKAVRKPTSEKGELTRETCRGGKRGKSS